MTELLRPDLAGKDAWMWAPLLKMLRAFVVEHFDELDPDAQLRMILARAIVHDPRLRLYAIVEAGALIGFGVATIEEQGPARWIYTLAGETHGDDGTIATRFFADLEDWGRQVGAEQILLATTRNPRAWTRKYHFESKRM